MKTILPITNFNSIKVRLEPAMSAEKLNEVLFQFHKGTIRTCDLKLHKLNLGDFNSIKVRLEPVNPWL